MKAPAFAIVIATAAIAAPPAAQDPWTKVPAFPTGLYQNKDDFSEKLAAAKDAVSKEFQRQEKLNSDISSRFKALGPAEIQSRMMAFMMEHPEDATKLMQRNQAVGDQGTPALLKGEANRVKLMEELKDLQTRYKAAVDKARAPFDAKFKELDARAQKDLVTVGESWTYAPWAVKEYDALVTQWNAEFQRICRDWWPASGLFPTWLARYREHLLQDQIPTWEEAENVGAGFMVHILDTPDASYKPTATLRAVREYMDRVAEVFGVRDRNPMLPY